jgi:hypothetical protein
MDVLSRQDSPQGERAPLRMTDLPSAALTAEKSCPPQSANKKTAASK